MLKDHSDNTHDEQSQNQQPANYMWIVRKVEFNSM